MQENHDEISRLQAENTRLLQEMQGLSQLLRLESDQGDESAAMRLAHLRQVSDLLEQVLRSQEDNNEYMRDLSARVDLLATRSGVPTLGEYVPPPEDTAGAALAEEGRSILEAAQLDRTRGNLDLARMGYQEFLEKYGANEGADEALYGLADLEYDAGNHELALSLFSELLARYPAGAKAPSALYKKRSCLLHLNRQEEAWDVGGELLAKFPDSDEAALLTAEREATEQN